MTTTIVKQVVGIDVAQKELVVSLGRMQSDLHSRLISHAVFANTVKGIEDLVKWTLKQTQPDISLRFVMEATGVYHELLAYHLDEQGYRVSIVLPNKISNYMRTLDTRTVTDKTASQAITLFGLERQLTDWQRPSPLFKTMRQLTRERDQLVNNRTIVKNQLHAENAEAFPNKDSIRRMTKHLAFLKKQMEEIEAALQTLIQKNAALKENVELCTSICGIGKLTAATGQFCRAGCKGKGIRDVCKSKTTHIKKRKPVHS
jgi:transposase